jgi:glycosyltransferase involved in cell wall biosynthesis
MYYVDSAAFGGAEQCLLNVLGELDRERWRPVLLHHPEPGLAPLLAQAERLDVALRETPRVRWRTGYAAFAPLVRRIAAERPAVFHAQLTWPLACKHGLLAAAITRGPSLVATAHLFIEHVVTARVRLQQRILTPLVQRYVAVSRAVAAHWERDLGVPRDKLRVVPNGIPLAPYEHGPSASPPEGLLADPAGRPTVLTAARLDAQKGLPHLLEAAAGLPAARFVVAGDGPERAALEAHARRLGLDGRLRFLGYRSDIPALLAACELVVLPSLFEGHPLALLEAMAAGRPVVATAVGGVPEIVDHGVTGLLVPPADSAALGAAIGALLADPARARAMGAAGRAKAEREFSARVMVERLTRVYDEVLDRAG